MLLTRLRDYSHEDRNRKMNNNKNSNLGLIIKMTLINVHNLRFFVDSRDRCIVNLDQKGNVIIA